MVSQWFKVCTACSVLTLHHIMPLGYNFTITWQVTAEWHDVAWHCGLCMLDAHAISIHMITIVLSLWKHIIYSCLFAWMGRLSDLRSITPLKVRGEVILGSTGYHYIYDVVEAHCYAVNMLITICSMVCNVPSYATNAGWTTTKGQQSRNCTERIQIQSHKSMHMHKIYLKSIINMFIHGRDTRDCTAPAQALDLAQLQHYKKKERSWVSTHAPSPSDGANYTSYTSIILRLEAFTASCFLFSDFTLCLICFCSVMASLLILCCRSRISLVIGPQMSLEAWRWDSDDDGRSGIARPPRHKEVPAAVTRDQKLQTYLRTSKGRNELYSDDVLNGCKKVTSAWGSTHGVVPCTLQAMDEAAVGSMRLSQGDLREDV